MPDTIELLKLAFMQPVWLLVFVAIGIALFAMAVVWRMR